MTSRNDRTGRPESTRAERVSVAFGLLIFMIGLGAWLWTGEWRHAASGFLIFVGFFTFAALGLKGNRTRD